MFGTNEETLVRLIRFELILLDNIQSHSEHLMMTKFPEPLAVLELHAVRPWLLDQHKLCCSRVLSGLESSTRVTFLRNFGRNFNK